MLKTLIKRKYARTLYKRQYSTNHTKKIMILGGTGNFGYEIAQQLLSQSQFKILICSRNLEKSQKAVNIMKKSNSALDDQIVPFEIDINDSEHLPDLIKRSGADLVIDATGPYLGDYSLARTCIEQGVSFIDLADQHGHVNNFQKELDADCKKNGVFAITGASTFPGLSGAMIDHIIKDKIKHVQKIEMYMSPGNHHDKGISTIKSALSYCGSKIEFKDSVKYGWNELETIYFLGSKRYITHVDIPDRSIYAKYFGNPVVITKAGIELKTAMIGIKILSWLCRMGILKDVNQYSSSLKKLIDIFRNCGTDTGCMKVKVVGTDHKNNKIQGSCTLLALQGDGPYIPVHPACIIAEKYVKGELTGKTGAFPCIGFFSMEEFLESMRGKQIHKFTDYDTYGNDDKNAFYLGLTDHTRTNLPKGIINFHCKEGIVEGTLTVWRKPGLLSYLLAKIAGVPQPKNHQSEMKCVVETSNNKWKRDFEGQILSSNWSFEKGICCETIGLWKFAFMLLPSKTENEGFEHIFKRAWFMNIPIPRSLSPSPVGKTIAHKDGLGWYVQTELSIPVFGKIYSYEGNVRIC
eukprot:TRINITY_DN7127_c0_g1_i2.p1 TRINITY_DN7127_c0_g1~~TRINITY_DN7127_c0_g1_i2.p1  ORF type:complete len:577 (+),score=90.14 TRINITY_DN7127_c0_g1_i2:11-1741(+)